MASLSTGSLASLGKIQGPWRDAVVEEVQRELEHPSRCLTELFRYASPRSEAELREYLRMRVEPAEAVETQVVESLEQ